MTINFITFFLVLILTLCQIIVLRTKMQNKSKRTNNDASAQIQEPQGFDSSDFQDLKNKISSIEQKLIQLEATIERKTNSNMIQKNVDSYIETTKKQNQKEQQEPDGPKHEDKKIYFVGHWTGKDLFTTVDSQKKAETKFEIRTNDDKTGELIPCDVSQFISGEVPVTVICKTNDSCDFNRANEMKIISNGKVEYESDKGYWRIKEPCLVKLS